MKRVSEDFVRQLQGYGLTTAEITYYFPDRPLIVSPNTLTLQMEDVAPNFPILYAYIDFWHREIEAKLHSIRYRHRYLIGPSEWRGVNGIISIN